MKTELWFYLLVVCGAVKGSTDMLVNLGQNVTLKCEIFVSNVYWYLIKPSEPPVFLLRTYTHTVHKAEYKNITLQKTFSLQYNSSLFIHNISANELGVYHCIQMPHIGTGIRLYIQNRSTEMTAEEPIVDTSPICSPELSILSVVLNCLLVIVVTIFTVSHCKRPGTAQSDAPDPGVQQNQDSSKIVYAEVQFRTSSRPVRPGHRLR